MDSRKRIPEEEEEKKEERRGEGSRPCEVISKEWRGSLKRGVEMNGVVSLGIKFSCPTPRFERNFFRRPRRKKKYSSSSIKSCIYSWMFFDHVAQDFSYEHSNEKWNRV